MRAWWARTGPWERIDDVLLAVTEAVANAVLHANPGRPGGQIVLCLRAGRGVLEVSVRDFGVGMGGAVPLSRPQLGLDVIRKMADSVEVSDADPGTLVTMRFRVS